MDELIMPKEIRFYVKQLCTYFAIQYRNAKTKSDIELYLELRHAIQEIEAWIEECDEMSKENES